MNPDITGNQARFNDVYVGEEPAPVISFIEVGSVNSSQVPSGIGFTLPLDTEVINTAPQVFTFINNGVLIAVSGFYLVTSFGQFQEGPSTIGVNRILQITKGSRAIYSYGTPNLDSITQCEISFSFQCMEGDFVTLVAFQDSGNTLSLRGTFQLFLLGQV